MAPEMICPRCQQPLIPAEPENKRCRKFYCTLCAEDFDTNFMCGGCGAKLVETGQTPEGRTLYDCSRCHKNKMMACVLCGFPRATWADDGKVCGSCFLAFMSGDIELSETQEIACRKWSVTLLVR